jgi:hypothetical protein
MHTCVYVCGAPVGHSYATSAPRQVLYVTFLSLAVCPMYVMYKSNLLVPCAMYMYVQVLPCDCGWPLLCPLHVYII